MYVNSPGGSVTAGMIIFLPHLPSPIQMVVSLEFSFPNIVMILTGMAIFDTMRHIRPDVSTVCVGLAARFVYPLLKTFR